MGGGLGDAGERWEGCFQVTLGTSEGESGDKVGLGLSCEELLQIGWPCLSSAFAKRLATPCWALLPRCQARQAWSCCPRLQGQLHTSLLRQGLRDPRLHLSRLPGSPGSEAAPVPAPEGWDCRLALRRWAQGRIRVRGTCSWFQSADRKLLRSALK